jgi:ABC-type transport system involved in cytochrome c biogenesis permease component
MFLPDGGANSIAGLDTTGNNGSNLIGIFGQWGTTQLVLVILYWILFIYDNSYMTLIFGLLALEYLLRIVEGRIKPLQTTKKPPGAVLSYVVLPLSIIFMICSYRIHGKWI